MLLRFYLKRHLNRLFRNSKKTYFVQHGPKDLSGINIISRAVIHRLSLAHKPLLPIDSQAVLMPERIPVLIRAIEALRFPLYLSGMARGLLAPSHPLLF